MLLFLTRGLNKELVVDNSRLNVFQDLLQFLVFFFCLSPSSYNTACDRPVFNALWYIHSQCTVDHSHRVCWLCLKSVWVPVIFYILISLISLDESMVNMSAHVFFQLISPFYQHNRNMKKLNFWTCIFQLCVWLTCLWKMSAFLNHHSLCCYFRPISQSWNL